MAKWKRVLIADYWLAETPDGFVKVNGWLGDRGSTRHATKRDAQRAWAYRVKTGGPRDSVTFVHVRRWRKL